MVTYHQLKRKERDMMQRIIDQDKTGQYIRYLCDHAGIKVTELQEILMLDSYQSIYHWFWGKSLPTVDNLYVLACTLHLPVEGLLILQDDSTAENHIADIIKWVAGKAKNSEMLRDVYISCLDIII